MMMVENGQAGEYKGEYAEVKGWLVEETVTSQQSRKRASSHIRRVSKRVFVSLNMRQHKGNELIWVQK